MKTPIPEEQAREALLAATGAFSALKAIGADVHLPGFGHTLAVVEAAITRLDKHLIAAQKDFVAVVHPHDKEINWHELAEHSPSERTDNPKGKWCGHTQQFDCQTLGDCNDNGCQRDRNFISDKSGARWIPVAADIAHSRIQEVAALLPIYTLHRGQWYRLDGLEKPK